MKDQEVHQFRLQNIALRNRLANKEKVLKKKEQLADGLHLIDFEQLKIENQTLNEKIEERNEELHKLKKKVTITVVILSHTREKLQYVLEQNRIKDNEREAIDKELKDEKNNLSLLKEKREDWRKKNQRLRQLTGIVNNDYLKEDFEARKKEIIELTDAIEQLEKQHHMLNAIIEEANRIQLAKQGQRP